MNRNEIAFEKAQALGLEFRVKSRRLELRKSDGTLVFKAVTWKELESFFAGVDFARTGKTLCEVFLAEQTAKPK